MIGAKFLYLAAGFAMPRIFDRNEDREELREMGATDSFLNLSDPGDFMVLNGRGAGGRQSVGNMLLRLGTEF